jgi:hypothetical protein
MSVKKSPIDPQRVRRIPAQGFSWIDRRFVREGFIEPLPPGAILLYFFLVAVGDARGLSFYADPTTSKILKLDAEELSQARARLVDADLILYRYPLYQVLSLPAKRKGPAFRATSPGGSRRGGDPVSLSEILGLAMKNARSSENDRSAREEKA